MFSRNCTSVYLDCTGPGGSSRQALLDPTLGIDSPTVSCAGSALPALRVFAGPLCALRSANTSQGCFWNATKQAFEVGHRRPLFLEGMSDSRLLLLLQLNYPTCVHTQGPLCVVDTGPMYGACRHLTDFVSSRKPVIAVRGAGPPAQTPPQ